MPEPVGATRGVASVTALPFVSKTAPPDQLSPVPAAVLSIGPKTVAVTVCPVTVCGMRFESAAVALMVPPAKLT